MLWVSFCVQASSQNIGFCTVLLLGVKLTGSIALMQDLENI